MIIIIDGKITGKKELSFPEIILFKYYPSHQVSWVRTMAIIYEVPTMNLGTTAGRSNTNPREKMASASGPFSLSMMFAVDQD